MDVKMSDVRFAVTHHLHIDFGVKTDEYSGAFYLGYGVPMLFVKPLFGIIRLDRVSCQAKQSNSSQVLVSTPIIPGPKFQFTVMTVEIDGMKQIAVDAARLGIDELIDSADAFNAYSWDDSSVITAPNRIYIGNGKRISSSGGELQNIRTLHYNPRITKRSHLEADGDAIGVVLENLQSIYYGDLIETAMEVNVSLEFSIL